MSCKPIIIIGFLQLSHYHHCVNACATHGAKSLDTSGTNGVGHFDCFISLESPGEEQNTDISAVIYGDIWLYHSTNVAGRRKVVFLPKISCVPRHLFHGYFDLLTLYAMFNHVCLFLVLELENDWFVDNVITSGREMRASWSQGATYFKGFFLWTSAQREYFLFTGIAESSRETTGNFE